MTSKHSPLGPSSAKRWINCSGSVALSARAPKQPPSEYAAEGTVAHALAEELVTGRVDPLELMVRVGSVVEQDGFKITITDEMVYGALNYRDLIESDKKSLSLAGKQAPIVGRAEVRVQAWSVDAELWGTADYVLYRKGDTLIVYDYKFGRGVIVDPVENEQASIYAIGVMDGDAGWAFDRVVIKIHQPRGEHIDGPVREWEAPVEWLRAFRDRLRGAVAATRVSDAPLKPGDWCRWCPAKAICPAIFAAVQESASAAFDVVAPAAPALPDVRLMSTEDLAKALSWQDAVESWFVAVKEHVTERLLAGEEIRGWKLVDGRSNRRWIDENAVVAEFSGRLGQKLYETKLLSPAKLEKVLGPGGKDAINRLTERPEARKSVARDDDARPKPVSQSIKAQLAFASVDPLWPKGKMKKENKRNG